MNHSVQLSSELYHLLQQQTAVLNATVESLVEAAVRSNYGQARASGLHSLGQDPAINGFSNGSDKERLPAGLASELDQLVFLTDDELWQAAHTQLNSNEQQRMEFLLDQQQAIGLVASELAEAETLADRYDRAMLIRAKAAVLLKERGFDITSFGPHIPLP
ncbi:MAG: hypothetical protein R3C14_45180 [Caldilineaceae bacterium]